METNNKDWLEVIIRLADFNNDPLIFLNESFEIIFSNQIASSLFLIDENNINLEQVFEDKTVELITDNAGIAVTKKTNISIKDINFILKTGSLINSDLSIDILPGNNSNQIVLLFKLIQKNTLVSDERIDLSVKSKLSMEQLRVIKEITDQIKSQYPFTLVSINRIHNLINNYSFPVFLQDQNGKILSLNEGFSAYLGVENSIALGKKLEVFLPQHKILVQSLINEIAASTKQFVILEISDKNEANSGIFKYFIYIPILDNINNIFCTLGLIVANKHGSSEYNNYSSFYNALLNGVPYPIGIAENGGSLIASNDLFAAEIFRDRQDIKNLSVRDLFSLQLFELFKSFLDQNDDKVVFRLDKELQITESSDYLFELLLNKVYRNEKSSADVLLIIKKQDNFEKSFDDLQNLLMYRGKMFEILIEKNPEPIFIYDKENLRFLEVNNAAVNLYGYSKQEFLQMDLTDLYAPEDIQTLLDSFGDESSESRFSKPFRHRKKDGTNVLVEISKTSFTFNDREAHFNIVKDITKNVETDKQNQMLKAIFAEAQMMIFTTDASGFITFVNHQVTERLGYKSDDLLQSSFASIVVDDDRGIVNTSIFQSYLKDTIALETQFKTSSGKLLDVEIFGSPIFDFDGEIDSFTIVVKTKEHVHEIPEPKEIIKEVVKEVIVEKPVKVEQKSLIPDSSFLSGMFHEILTPINVIIGFSQELFSSADNPTEEQKEAAEIINQNRIKMMDTMNSVVEYSDILQNKSALKIEDVTITEIIEKLDSNIKDISGINDIIFSYGKISSSLKFKSDPQKFESFILSLIKVVSRISKDKKIYFSAFSLDAELFFLGISDQYGNPSEYVSNVLEQVYINNRDPKDFGLPKLTTYLSKTLLSLLDGKFYRSSAISVRPETGFIFPIFFKQKSDFQYFETISEPAVFRETIHQEFQPVITAPADSKVDEEIQTPGTEIVEDNLNKSHPGHIDEVPAIEESQIVPGDQDSINESVQNIQTVEEYYAAFANEIEAGEPGQSEINSETESKPEQDKSDIQSDLVQEIKQELETTPVVNKTADVPRTVDLSKLNCLYIEDQIDSQILFKVQMKGLNDIKFAAGFEDAQLLLLNHQFDFIVMDINLQGEYNGLDALKIIKTMPAFSSIPIIAVTAYVLPGDKEKFIAAGFDDFISKPIFREKMMESLEKIFLSR